MHLVQNVCVQTGTVCMQENSGYIYFEINLASCPLARQLPLKDIVAAWASMMPVSGSATSPARKVTSRTWC